MPKKPKTQKPKTTIIKNHKNRNAKNIVVIKNYGEGIVSDAVKYLKSGISKAHKYVKDNKLISKGLEAYSASNPTSTAGGLAYIGSNIASYLGYGNGRVKPVPVRKRGGNKTKIQKGILP